MNPAEEFALQQGWDEGVERSQEGDVVVADAAHLIRGYKMLMERQDSEIAALRRNAADMAEQMTELKELSRRLAKQYALTGGDYWSDD